MGACTRGREAADAARDAELVRLFGVRVLRVTAGEVEADLDGVLGRIRRGAG